MKIACLGPKGTFSHKIGKEFFPKSKIFFKDGLFDVFESVRKKQALYGIIPVENSKEGLVLRTLDLMRSTKLNAAGEIYLEVKQNLLTNEKKFKDIRKVYSHQQGIAQSRAWLTKHLPRTSVVEVTSTAEGARIASQNKNAAAVGSISASKEYGLKVLARNIHGTGRNITRFWIISHKTDLPKEIKGLAFYKTTVYFSIHDKPGALSLLLNIFAKYNINLSSIVSRPLHGKVWEYGFFIDYMVCKKDPFFARSIKEAHKNGLVKEWYLLGSYPMYGNLPVKVFGTQIVSRVNRIFGKNARVLRAAGLGKQALFKNPFLVQALNTRELIIASVAYDKFKKKSRILDSSREKNILSRINKKETKAVYKKIFSMSRAFQKAVVLHLKKNIDGGKDIVKMPVADSRYYLNLIDDIIIFYMS